MKKIYVALILLFAQTFTQAQELSTYISDVVARDLDRYAPGLQAYAKGEYQKAFEGLSAETKADGQYDFLNKLRGYALVYQRDQNLLGSKLKEDPQLLNEFYQFYATQPAMEIALEGKTATPLDKNLFTAILNGKDTLTVMLDTGAGGVGINAEWVRKYNMDRDTTIVRSGSLPAFGITFEKHPVLIPEIQIGSMIMTNIPGSYTAPDSESGGEYTGPKFDMIMGLDIFLGFIEQVTFDWTTNELVFHEKTEMTEGLPFIFYGSKPITSTTLRGKKYTTVLDTGSGVDIIPPEIYLKDYSKKEEKTYEQYSYVLYTLPVELPGTKITELQIGDFTREFDLVLDGLPVPFLIGHKHQKMSFNLAQNRVIIE
ncbi:Aspartyl protease [Robiginitalea myxolifaciens]|uniref:Aspartyl protease n=1 Tax=Robiginitalea myxolifaciens TaxID=400055 RepID=A0A1I6HCR8_9FLAO|nr:aspartyl protease family protein [Robiginitalea myxolifaciens]SFR52150.1 Aspartyl protease [Robiginitalea myxolifaciens]